MKINKNTVSLIASVLVGLTFVASGTGKVFGHESVSAQVVDFMTSVVPEVFLTPLTVAFLYNIFIPYVFPWIELILGLFLLIGFIPRLTSLLCIPLILVITSTNVWAIARGSYATCASCFGFWEDIFGTLTPVQSLTIDLILLALVLIVLFTHPGGFLSSRAWLSGIIESKAVPRFFQKLWRKVKLLPEKAGKAIAMKPRMFKLGIIGVIGVALVISGAVMLTGIFSQAPEENAGAVISGVQVKNITETGGIITWMTDKPVQSYVLIYDKNRVAVQEIPEKSPYTAHMVGVSGLEPGSLYYFHIVTDTAAKPDMVSAYSFTTMAAAEEPLTISGIGITGMTAAGATVIWTTNKPASGEVEYWKAGTADRTFVFSEGDAATAHRVSLSGLEPGGRYYFIVKSSGAGKTETTASDEKTFTLDPGTTGFMAAPDFALKSLDGETVRLSDYRGKVVLLNFWQSSCADCRIKMNIIKSTVDRLPADAGILAIHVEGREVVIRAYAVNEKITIPVLPDLDRQVSRLYNVTGVPTVFFIDRDGAVRMKDVEFETPEELLALFDSLLNLPGNK